MGAVINHTFSGSGKRFDETLQSTYSRTEALEFGRGEKKTTKNLFIFINLVTFKGVVQPKMKTHHYATMLVEAPVTFSNLLEFHGGKEFHQVEVHCGQVLQHEINQTENTSPHSLFGFIQS